MTNPSTRIESTLGGWRDIETLPEFTDALVCATHNVPSEEGDTRPTAGDGYVWETVQWVDWYSKELGWFAYPQLVHVPFPPTHWMPLPPPPPGEQPSMIEQGPKLHGWGENIPPEFSPQGRQTKP